MCTSALQGGKLQGDALAYIEHWYLSVTRLGLPAVVFHEALSQEFVERVQTGGLVPGRVGGRAEWGWGGGCAMECMGRCTGERQ